MHLQERLPKARVVYCSATGVTEPRHLGYMSRLGLWGPGTTFPGGFESFLNVVTRSGVGAMEVGVFFVLWLGLVGWLVAVCV